MRAAYHGDDDRFAAGRAGLRSAIGGEGGEDVGERAIGEEAEPGVAAEARGGDRRAGEAAQEAGRLTRLGQRVRVDGASGRITVLEDAPPVTT